MASRTGIGCTRYPRIAVCPRHGCWLADTEITLTGHRHNLLFPPCRTATCSHAGHHAHRSAKDLCCVDAGRIDRTV
ncbi:MAG: hypothetical protein ACLT3F_05975 [Gemmiger formicilis]|uniref:hypothetical protein n=1 Tax=Gemmiger formicilis TaxID=745368 RepID=UPI003994D837